MGAKPDHQEFNVLIIWIGGIIQQGCPQAGRNYRGCHELPPIEILSEEHFALRGTYSEHAQVGFRQILQQCAILLVVYTYALERPCVCFL